MAAANFVQRLEAFLPDLRRKFNGIQRLVDEKFIRQSQ